MDPENYDNYGGVEHLKYCFEVCCGNFHLHCRRACFCWFVCSHAWNFDKVFPPICFRIFIFKISCQRQYNLNQFNNMILYLLVRIHRIGIGILKVIVGLNGIGTCTYVSNPTAWYLISGGWVMNVCIWNLSSHKRNCLLDQGRGLGRGQILKFPHSLYFLYKKIEFIYKI